MSLNPSLKLSLDQRAFDEVKDNLSKLSKIFTSETTTEEMTKLKGILDDLNLNKFKMSSDEVKNSLGQTAVLVEKIRNSISKEELKMLSPETIKLFNSTLNSTEKITDKIYDNFFSWDDQVRLVLDNISQLKGNSEDLNKNIEKMTSAEDLGSGKVDNQFKTFKEIEKSLEKQLKAETDINEKFKIRNTLLDVQKKTRQLEELKGPGKSNMLNAVSGIPGFGGMDKLVDLVVGIGTFAGAVKLFGEGVKMFNEATAADLENRRTLSVAGATGLAESSWMGRTMALKDLESAIQNTANALPQLSKPLEYLQRAAGTPGMYETVTTSGQSIATDLVNIFSDDAEVRKKAVAGLRDFTQDVYRTGHDLHMSTDEVSKSFYEFNNLLLSGSKTEQQVTNDLYLMGTIARAINVDLKDYIGYVKDLTKTTRYFGLEQEKVEIIVSKFGEELKKGVFSIQELTTSLQQLNAPKPSEGILQEQYLAQHPELFGGNKQAQELDRRIREAGLGVGVARQLVNAPNARELATSQGISDEAYDKMFRGMSKDTREAYAKVLDRLPEEIIKGLTKQFGGTMEARQIVSGMLPSYGVKEQATLFQTNEFSKAIADFGMSTRDFKEASIKYGSLAEIFKTKMDTAYQPATSMNVKQDITNELLSGIYQHTKGIDDATKESKDLAARQLKHGDTTEGNPSPQKTGK